MKFLCTLLLEYVSKLRLFLRTKFPGSTTIFRSWWLFEWWIQLPARNVLGNICDSRIAWSDNKATQRLTFGMPNMCRQRTGCPTWHQTAADLPSLCWLSRLALLQSRPQFFPPISILARPHVVTCIATYVQNRLQRTQIQNLKLIPLEVTLFVTKLFA